jgi:UDP-N-acetylmuramoyl-L-alanyl-D-glutamate--2,6-diaminopimelate ligase
VEKILKDILYKVALTEVIGTTIFPFLLFNLIRKIEGRHCLFIAVKGLTVDGHDFIDQTIKKGAAAIVCEAIT